MMQAFGRMAFNVAARNHDDHTKNVAFLLERGQPWRLAPAYDLTFAYNPLGRWNKIHFLSVNGKFDDITRTDLLAVARRFAIPNAETILARVNDAVLSWPQFATEAGLDTATIEAVAANHVPIGAPPKRTPLPPAPHTKGQSAPRTKK